MTPTSPSTAGSGKAKPPIHSHDQHFNPRPDKFKKLKIAAGNALNINRSSLNLPHDYPDCDDLHLADLTKQSDRVEYLHICETAVTVKGLLQSFFNDPASTQKLSSLKGFCAIDFQNSFEMHHFYGKLSEVSNKMEELYLNGEIEGSWSEPNAHLLQLLERNKDTLNKIHLKDFVLNAACIQVLAQCPLTELKLQHCLILPEAEQCFGDLQMDVLVLDFCFCGGKMEALLEAVTQCEDLQELLIGNIPLSKDLLSVLQGCKNLDSIALIGCRLQAQDHLCLNSFPVLTKAKFDGEAFTESENAKFSELVNAAGEKIEVTLQQPINLPTVRQSRPLK